MIVDPRHEEELFEAQWLHREVLEEGLSAVDLRPSHLSHSVPLAFLEGIMPDHWSYKLFLKRLFLGGCRIIAGHTRHGIPLEEVPQGFRRCQFQKLVGHVKVLDHYGVTDAVALGYSEGAIIANDIARLCRLWGLQPRFRRMLLIEPAGLVRKPLPLLFIRSMREALDEQRRNREHPLEYWWQADSPESGGAYFREALIQTLLEAWSMNRTDIRPGLAEFRRSGGRVAIMHGERGFTYRLEDVIRALDDSDAHDIFHYVRGAHHHDPFLRPTFYAEQVLRVLRGL